MAETDLMHYDLMHYKQQPVLGNHSNEGDRRGPGLSCVSTRKHLCVATGGSMDLTEAGTRVAPQQDSQELRTWVPPSRVSTPRSLKKYGGRGRSRERKGSKFPKRAQARIRDVRCPVQFPLSSFASVQRDLLSVGPFRHFLLCTQNLCMCVCARVCTFLMKSELEN